MARLEITRGGTKTYAMVKATTPKADDGSYTVYTLRSDGQILIRHAYVVQSTFTGPETNYGANTLWRKLKMTNKDGSVRTSADQVATFGRLFAHCTLKTLS
jgi:hypothetical protein